MADVGEKSSVPCWIRGSRLSLISLLPLCTSALSILAPFLDRLFFPHGDKMAASTSKLPSGPFSTSVEKEKSVPLKVPELNPIGSDRAGLSSRAYI